MLQLHLSDTKFITYQVASYIRGLTVLPIVLVPKVICFVVITTACGVTSGVKVVIITAFCCQRKKLWFCCIWLLYTLGPRQIGRHFPDDIFKCIFWYENVWIAIKISLMFVPMSPSNNIPALFQIMAWRLPGDKPLSETMLVSLLTHICVSRPQWVNLKMLFDMDYFRSLLMWSLMFAVAGSLISYHWSTASLHVFI